MKKIAISFTGLYRPNIQIPPMQSIELMKKKFGADLYFHTWYGREHEVPEIYRTQIGKFFPSKEPKMEYHPVFDPEPTTNPKHHWYKKTRFDGHKTINGNKQIISYAQLFEMIPKKYDIYIKTRWDTTINPVFNFHQFYPLLEEGPVGFMTRGQGPNAHDYTSEKHKVVPKTKSKTENNDWHDMLSDTMIMHKEEHFDPKLVMKLHREKQLLSSEWGWWQVMSKPFGGDNHTCVYGGCHIIR